MSRFLISRPRHSLPPGQAERPIASQCVPRFHKLCVASPYIPSLVETLCIHGYHRGPTLLRPTSGIVNSILQFMQNLKVIKFYDVTISDFCDGSLARLSSYFFREIHLYDVVFHENGFGQMCAVLQGSPDLERLFVHHTSLITVSMFGGDETSQPRLDHTHVTHRGPLIRDLSITKPCLLSIDKLHRFAFSLSENIDLQHLEKILTLIRHSSSAVADIQLLKRIGLSLIGHASYRRNGAFARYYFHGHIWALCALLFAMVDPMPEESDSF
ncbi:hypothetical protein DFS33DRAFT_109886 [Desarmillaria ectypa]|nr:hypothetical protein DFS33DRAFT_109886 [Desarmillaria ectypa]